MLSDMSAFDSRLALFPEILTLHGRWRAAQAAIIDGERTLSWSAFDSQLNQVANGLLALGVQPGDRVAVLMHNSLEMVVALLGTIKAGAVSVPLNLSISDQSLVAMVVDSGAVALIASDEQCARVEQLRAQIPGIPEQRCIGVNAPPGRWQEFRPWLDAQLATPPSVSLEPDRPCNIIYSSGTTGTPKGIVHSHLCRIRWAADVGDALRYHSGAVTVCSLGLFSNISWVSMLATFYRGGTVVVMRSFRPADLLEHIARHRVTHGAFVPVQLQRLLELDTIGSYDLSSLQTLMCCGSPLPVPIKRGIAAALSCELIELYGLTEGLVTTLAPEDFDAKITSVGKPLPGTDIVLLDEADRAVPAGEAGEIVGRSSLIMSGYHNRPEANAEATWTDPAGRRWFRTGDIGRLDADGFLYIVDRKKDMLLSGGQNVYPADIEEVVRQHAAVAETAVIGVPSERWGETPLAVVVLRAGHAVVAAELVEWINARVGKQQRLSGVVLRASLPRNPNGKVLKRELRREYNFPDGSAVNKL
jgi:acyl-CoA synthetase (AMP-forming)/AMP-acid ligase II